MKIANAEKLKEHFENVVDVHLFTVPEILTIIETFTREIPDGAVAREDIRAGKFRPETIKMLTRETGKTMLVLYETGWNDALDAVADKAPDIFGGEP